MTISLGGLERLRAAMQVGTWQSSEVDGFLRVQTNDGGQHNTYVVFDDAYANDAAGVIAEHNAIPALIDIAVAALAYMAANDDQTTHGDTYHRNRAHANDVLRQALAKVSP